MMTRCQVPAALIHQIEQELDEEEEEMMVFLCRDLAPDLANADLRELLVALSEREKLSLLGLSELLYRVKRFDLLRRILKTEKATVEADLARSLRLVPDYRYYIYFRYQVYSILFKMCVGCFGVRGVYVFSCFFF